VEDRPVFDPRRLSIISKNTSVVVRIPFLHLAPEPHALARSGCWMTVMRYVNFLEGFRESPGIPRVTRVILWPGGRTEDADDILKSAVNSHDARSSIHAMLS
jgi:hypothetical protein